MIDVKDVIDYEKNIVSGKVVNLIGKEMKLTRNVNIMSIQWQSKNENTKKAFI